MPGLLEGKVAIVTGAGRGIGRAHALTLAAHGASLVVNDLGGEMDGSGSDSSASEVVAEEIRAAGGSALADDSDISDWSQAHRLIQRATSAFGGLDIVINNAGIVRYSTILEETPENWHRTMAVNLGGSAAMIHWAARYWRDEGPSAGRAIVNTCSPTATAPTSGCSAYSASKGAIATLTLTSAIELADLGVRVNAIVPVARTRMAEVVTVLADALKQVGEGLDRLAPEHPARAALYLASPSCPLTGRLLGIEGDDAWLFNGFSATEHRNNGGRPWEIADLERAFAGTPREDEIQTVAGSTLTPVAEPPAETFDALEKVARGEPVKLTPFLHT